MAKFGLSVAILTPFCADGSVDVGRLADHASDLMARGAQSITIFGTTGEGPSIGISERAPVLKALADRGITGEQVIQGVCASAIPDVLAIINIGLEFGVRDVLLAPPFYFTNLDDEGLFEWHAGILAQSPDEVRIILYNIPQVTDVPLSVALTRRLVETFPDRIRAMKDSSGNWDSSMAYLDIAGLTVLVGDERLLARAIQRGAGGSICGMSNLYPEKMRHLIDTGEEDPFITAQTNAVVAHPVVAAIKTLMSRQTNQPDWNRLRPPLSALQNDAMEALISATEGKTI